MGGVKLAPAMPTTPSPRMAATALAMANDVARGRCPVSLSMGTASVSAGGRGHRSNSRHAYAPTSLSMESPSEDAGTREHCCRNGSHHADAGGRG